MHMFHSPQWKLLNSLTDLIIYVTLWKLKDV